MSKFDEITKKMAAIFENGQNDEEVWEEASKLFFENEKVILNTPMKRLSELTLDRFEAISCKPFGPKSPITLNYLTNEQLLNYPLFNQMLSLLSIINFEIALKLTPSGAIPTNIVKELHAKGRPNIYALGRVDKVSREADSETITMARRILEACGYIHIRNKKLVTTAKYARDVKQGDLHLFHTLFRTAMLEVDVSEFDTLIEDEFVNKNIGFSLFLLHKFGIRKRSTEHYSKDFFNAYNPINIFEDHYEFTEYVEDNDVRKVYHHFFYELNVAYIVRTYGRMFNYWGLITLEEIANTMDYKIKATPAFYDLIAVKQE